MSRHLATAALAAVASSLGAPLLAQQPVVTTVYGSGTTQSRYDMVILGDGYQAFEQTRFNQDVQTFLAALFQKQPYATFANYYNVHTVFRASIDSGADHPDVTPPIYKNTVYDATYNVGGTARCLYIQNTAQALADAALAPANEGRVLVFVNDSRYGGCASTFAVSYNGTSMAEVQIHEIGHSIGGLADEYDYPNQTYSGSEPSQANITASPTGQKWLHWHGTESVSAFQGAGYYLYGLYRPKNNCLMRTLGQIMCPVCREQVALRTNAIVDTVVPVAPTQSSFTLLVPNQTTLSIAHFVPAAHNPTISWTIDGNVVPGAATTSLLLDSTTLSIGNHVVSAHVRDNSPHVRQDPLQQMVETETWNVTVSNPNAAQLRPIAFTLNQIWVQPGSPVTLNTTVRNDGPAAAGSFDVDYFLTTTQPWTTQSTYLGKSTVASLGVGQNAVLQRTVQLPFALDPRVHYVYAVVDRQNHVMESNESDNERLSAVVGQAGPCTTKLEFQEPLTYPFDTATLSLAQGGAVQPKVVAPCLPGALYLIVWGASGTTPGTPIGNGLVVPLNRDAFTDLGLAGLNGPWFAGFFGGLDSQGRSLAQFQLPANSGLPAMTSHFAAMLIDANGFAAVTNPVTLQLQ